MDIGGWCRQTQQRPTIIRCQKIPCMLLDQEEVNADFKNHNDQFAVEKEHKLIGRTILT